MLKLFAQGIKSISHGQYVDLGSKLTFLVGPNSAGKSTVVEVLRMLNAELKNWKVRSEHRVFESHELPLAGLPSRSVHQVNSSPRRVSAISTVGLAAESRGMRCELHFSASRTSSGSIQDFRALYDDIDEADIDELGGGFVTYIENDRLCFLEQYSATDYLAGLSARNSMLDGLVLMLQNKYKFSRQYVLLIDDDDELIYFSEWIDRLLTDRNIEKYSVKNFIDSQDSRYLRFSYNILLGFIKSIFSGPELQREINKLDKLNSKILRRVKEIKAKFGFFSDLLAEPNVVDPVRSLPAQAERVKIINLLEDDDVSDYEALLRSGARKVWGETANAIRSPEAEEEVYLDDTLLDDVNRALSEHLFIDQGYQVAVDARLLIGKDELHEAIDAFDIGDIIVSPLECYSEMSLVDSHGRRLAFDEVGSGIGYVLPALISSHSSKKKLVVLQQPELHLHPALQAALTDVLIEALGDNNKKIICETHSEHMILRALRRVRQTTAGKLIDQQLALSSDDVMVNYFEPKIGGGTKIYPLRVSEDGDFVDRWPHGFFSERDQELFDE